MPKNKKKSQKSKFTAKKEVDSLVFDFRHRRFTVLLDKVLAFRLIRRLHGRFWGVAAMIGLLSGLAVCYTIRPDLLSPSAAISDFGKDVKTAPYFAGAVFFSAYGLWRWRNYLARTLKRTRPIIPLITLTIIGLYLVALMPISWKPWPYKVHIFGVILAGTCMALTVIFDVLMSKTRRSHNASRTRIIKLFCVILIIVGGVVTLGSAEIVGRFQLALVGEVAMLLGYGSWVILKTYQGEDPRSSLSKQLKKIVLVN
ncbi:hypothetical protein H6794_02290 [Candidatus Nomurabacteria bacterium]|jgi:hypothetical protein|nr:hypothetical protein [Candidatus Saccharibacteria bacterium]MCB9839661.1 hypothetical protein [Candidatus Nomurabacteria bacterium]